MTLSWLPPAHSLSCRQGQRQWDTPIIPHLDPKEIIILGHWCLRETGSPSESFRRNQCLGHPVWPAELWENTFLLWKPPPVAPVMVAPGNQCAALAPERCLWMSLESSLHFHAESPISLAWQVGSYNFWSFWTVLEPTWHRNSSNIFSRGTLGLQLPLIQGEVKRMRWLRMVRAAERLWTQWSFWVTSSSLHKATWVCTRIL